LSKKLFKLDFGGTVNEELLAIGEVSRRAGVPTDTIRTWERRYGFPVPIRMPSGHRRYRREVVEKLRLMALGKQMGVRPSATSKWSESELRSRFLDEAPMDRTTGLVGSAGGYLEAVQQMDGAMFDGRLMAEWNRLGAVRFLDEVLGPLLVQVGEWWADGTISVGGEHWVSERVRALLTNTWTPLARGNSRAPLVCACLPGEQHDLGLHMAAVVVAVSGGLPVFLGANSPVNDIIETAVVRGARNVLVSVALGADPTVTATALTELTRGLPAGTQLLVGGAGAPRGDAWRTLVSWSELAPWV
jgi:methanogenic corrinoid protein MtbC1